MKRIGFLLLVLLVAMAIALPACAEPAPAPTPAPAPIPTTPIKWIMPSFYSAPGAWPVDVIPPFCDAVKERTSGMLDIHLYYSGELGIDRKDFPSALQTGSIQLAHASAGYYSEEIEAAAMSAMPAISRSHDEGAKFSVPLRHFMDRQFGEKYNVKVLFAAPWTHGQVMTQTKIKDFADLEGRKIRVSVKPVGDMLTNLNGTPVLMPFGEIYMALQKGVLDGYCTSIDSIVSEKFFEVVDYVNLYWTHGGLVVWLMSLDAYNALPEDFQKIVAEEADKAEYAAMAAGRAELTTFVPIVKQLGLTVSEPTEAEVVGIRKGAKPVWDAFYLKASAEGREEFLKAFERLGVPYTPPE